MSPTLPEVSVEAVKENVASIFLKPDKKIGEEESKYAFVPSKVSEVDPTVKLIRVSACKPIRVPASKESRSVESRVTTPPGINESDPEVSTAKWTKSEET
jgi:hypothetical protein